MPSTARPSHLGGRASGTWPDKEKSESGDEIDKRSAAFPLRCLRGALHLWRCLSEVYFRSRADVSLCALPLSSSNPPPSPFASYLSCVCLAGGNKRLHREAAPSRRLDGYQNSSLRKRPTDPRNHVFLHFCSRLDSVLQLGIVSSYPRSYPRAIP